MILCFCTLIQATLDLYPTVGLQTPGEIVEANFGESPFVFDFEGMLAVRYVEYSMMCISICELLYTTLALHKFLVTQYNLYTSS